MLRALYFCLFLFCIATCDAQVKLFVAVNGNDQNSGSLQRPLKTVEKAVNKASESHEKVSIELRGGTYYLDRTIVINSASFLPSALEISPFPGEKAVVSAGRALQLHWEPYRDGIYKAVVPAGISFERLYVNGRLQILARYPNYDATARVYHGTAADAVAPERVEKWKNPAGGYLHALHQGEWGSFDYRITGADPQGNLQFEGGWQNNRPAPMHKQLRFVENIFEELDAPGEWFLDKKQHLLYYFPSKGTDLSTARVEVSHLKNAIELRGTTEHPVRNVHLIDLSFAHTERTFMETREPLVRSDWTIYRGGAVLLNGTENCIISNCSFIGLGGNAIMVSDYNKHDTIKECLIADIGASAVCFVGDPKAVRSPLFKYEASLPYEQVDKIAGPLTNNYPQQCLVDDNLIRNVGDIEKQATGVEIDMALEITVSHNTIYNTPRAGINIGDGCWGGHVIAYNDVFNTVLETGDHGAFNSWGRDRFWGADRKYMDSIVAVHSEMILLDVQKQNVIHDNRFRCDHGWDIDLDDGSTNYHIYNNVCLNGGIKLREGFYRVVENNIMINNAFHPHVWFKNSGDVFMHNIVTKKYAPIGINYWGKEVDYNLFSDTAALHAAQKSGIDGHSIAGDALFADAKTGNYTVAVNSPALAIGFHNIPMDEFGVQKASLKKIAESAPIPELITNDASADKSQIVPFLGGTIKSVDGLGDRSAYGLPDESGVVVMSIGLNSLLSKSGLKDKDVLRSADDMPVNDIRILKDIVQSANWKGKIPVEIIRNQQPMKVVLLLK